jgi:hypothetical protein
MRNALLVCLGLVVAGGCRKQSATEFYALEGQATALADRDGDDAWTSPEMDVVVAGLERIPPAAIEGPRAAALLARITSERARLAAEKARQVQPVEVSPPSSWRPPVAPVAVDATPAATDPQSVDAGPSPEAMPTAGMPEADFIRLFGACFKSGGALAVQGGKQATSQVMVDSPACTRRFSAGQGEVAYVFVEGKFAGTRTTERKTTTLPPPPPPPVAAVDAGEPRLVYPGQPVE